MNRIDALAPSLVIGWLAYFISGVSAAFFAAFVLSYVLIVAILVAVVGFLRPQRLPEQHHEETGSQWVGGAAE